MYEFKFNYCKTLSSVSSNEIEGRVFFSGKTQFKNQYRYLRKMRQIETTTTYTHTHTHCAPRMKKKIQQTIQTEFSKRIRFNGESIK